MCASLGTHTADALGPVHPCAVPKSKMMNPNPPDDGWGKKWMLKKLRYHWIKPVRFSRPFRNRHCPVESAAARGTLIAKSSFAISSVFLSRLETRDPKVYEPYDQLASASLVAECQGAGEQGNGGG